MLAKKRDKVLLVLPYGMCFRNIVFNEDLWGYLECNYEVDLLTPLTISDENKRRLGINNIYSFLPKSRFDRLKRSINHRAIYYLKHLENCDFFLGQYLEAFLGENYRITNKKWRRDLLFLGALNNTAVGNYIKKFFKRFPVFYPTKSVLQENKYKFIITTHISENECIITSILANRLKVPVICTILGPDHLLHHQLLGSPDLLLLLGSDQVSEFERFQIGFNANLKNVKYMSIGNLMYDTYLRIENNKERFLSTYNLKPDEEIILFPAIIEYMFPGQRNLCEHIIEFIKKHNLKVKLLIRVRPGFDEEMWLEFQSRYSDSVIVDIPRGVSYDKSHGNLPVDMDTELKHIALFADAVRNSALVVNPCLSTMYFDALALGTPAVLAFYLWDKKNPTGLHPSRTLFHAKSALYSQWYRMNAILSEEELTAFLKKFFVEKDRSGLLSKELLEARVHLADGNVGKRVVEAIKNVLDEKEGARGN